ncbi:protein kinase domain-containing protein [Botryosphaeria dothidea]|uniref:Protein kinase domain-containing protein n=1 Tax=Botryosphaeria dothidea TaxID=55169 RepID=A0A8H4IT60_9PEZI|nr:protein kinase domain-containing protein [Botryosphaeria dothidea]KAF4305947.1 protein kinase domain-containing protein [Botryosphaeria dothidea]
MGSKSLTNVVTQNSIALNAYIYGYAGHSLVTPHAPLQQLWWTQERIDAKVTADFVASRLRKEERELLNKPLAFGDGLTDDTYLEWILERAKRLFLTLVEVGVPDQIFGVIDDSWDDEDLPISFDTVERLALSRKKDDQLNRKFYQTQFTFLLRELHRGAHIDYGPNEVIPMEHVYKLPPAAALQHWSRVHLPKKPHEVFVRRRVSLGENSEAGKEEFLKDVAVAQEIGHQHIAPVWASYTSKGNGFVITPFVGQHTLKSFIDHRTPAQYMQLSLPDRRILLLNWMHCLADAVATIHGHDLVHGAISPSNIVVDERNDIAFCDIGSLKSLQGDKKILPEEVYNYVAPEAHEQSLANLLAPTTSPSKSKPRRASMDSEASSHGSQNSAKTTRTARKIGHMANASFAAFDFGFNNKSPAKPDDALSATSFADVFSLGCIFLDILTFMIKKKPSDFIKHRTTKHKTPGKSGSRSDASFHANIDKLHTWMQHLETLAMEHEDVHFRTFAPLLTLIRDMVQPVPEARLSSFSVADRLRDLLADHAGLVNLHCEPHELRIGHAHNGPMSPRSDLHAIPEDGVEDDESLNGDDVHTVADEATLRFSVADSMMSDTTAVGSMRTLSIRPKSIASAIHEMPFPWSRKNSRDVQT